MNTFSCEFSQRLGALHYCEVPAPERKVLEAHIGLCPACAQQMEQLKALTQLFTTSRTAAVPQIILHRFAREVAWAGVLKLARALSCAAAAVLVVSTGWIWYTESADSQSSVPTASLALRTDSSGSSDSNDPVVQALMKEYGRD